MQIILLTHQRELEKKSNTGRLVLETLGHQAEVIVWDRVNPDPKLLELIEQGSVALIYPTSQSLPLGEAAPFTAYILLDGTWQEAKKIYNKSPYLKTLPKVQINTQRTSAYHLRRNQKANGLCTAECVIELLKSQKNPSKAAELESQFFSFISNN